ncbi:MAG: TonB-dependent receptor [Aureispira sp.]|nr:TonB-dependent receptor [Aureispira sp.]
MQLIKTILFLLFYLHLVCSNLNAQSAALDTKISLDLKNKPIRVVLKKIQQLSKSKFVYDQRKVPVNRKISIKVKNKEVKKVLEQTFAGTDIDFKAFGKQISLFPNPNKKATKAPPSTTITKQKHTISGYLYDVDSKEPLIGATVLDPKSYKGTTTNIEGFYSLTLPQGEYDLVWSYIGYDAVTRTVSLKKNVQISLSLSSGQQLEEVVVSAKDSEESRHELNEIGTIKLSMDKVKALPSLMGEADIIKAMQLIPGVQSGGEGTSGLMVRGGSPDQNLILLDGAPIYNANHIFGFVSIFGSSIVKDAKLIKGGFPARYGGRLSSVLDVHTKEGNLREWHGEASIGLLSAQFTLEGPILKDKTSILISGRRSWVDLFGVPIQRAIRKKTISGQVLNYSFFDLNLKLKHKFSEDNYLLFSGYLGEDLVSVDNKTAVDIEFGLYSTNINRLKWGNRIANIQWNKSIGSQVFARTTLSYTHYRYNSSNLTYSSLDYFVKGAKNEVYKFDSLLSVANSRVHDASFKLDFDYIPHTKHYVRFGAGYIFHQFLPSIQRASFDWWTQTTSTNIASQNSVHELYTYIEDDIKIGKILKINPGLHFSTFLLSEKVYWSIQPRLIASLLIAKNSSIKASYSRMTQFVHLLTNPGIGLPTDLWVPTTNNIPPEHSHQWSLSYTQGFGKGYELTVEGFYKSMENLLEYETTTNFLATKRSWETLVNIGKGQSYGAELFFEKRLGKLTGWLGYTLSWSNRQFDHINDGKPFPYRYDRRHDLSIALNYKFSPKFDIGAVWVYGSGHAVTLGLETYSSLPIQQDESYLSLYYNSTNSASQLSNIKERNNYRMPDYHRLDLSANFHKELKRGSQTISFGVYNVYFRKNAYMLVPKQVQDEYGQEYTVITKISLLPIMPFFTYTRNF